MKILYRIKYFLKDIPLNNPKNLLKFFKNYFFHGFHQNHLKKKNLIEIREDRFVNFLAKNISGNLDKNQIRSEINPKNKIKIVFTINAFNGIGGTENWLSEMVAELSNKNIEHLIFIGQLDKPTSNNSTSHLNLTNKISDVISFSPDLIHLQHPSNRHIKNLLKHLDKKIPVFNLIHGIAPIMELPFIDSNWNVEYGAVSRIAIEKVSFLTGINQNKIHLLRNFFRQEKILDIHDKNLSKCAIVSSKINSAQMNSWEKLIKNCSIDVDFYGYSKDKMISNYEKVINKYDFFMCSGKTALDLLGFGKPVILLEGNLLGPAVIAENIHHLSDMNFALTNPLIAATSLDDNLISDILKREISKIFLDDRSITNAILENQNSIGAVAKHLVDIYLTIIEKSKSHEKI
jgi:hypothetical protein